MAKYFKDIYKPITVEIENIKGETFKLESRFKTLEDTRNIEIMLQDPKRLESDKLIEIMIALFGKDEIFYRQFSVEILTEVSKYMRDESKKKLTTTPIS